MTRFSYLKAALLLSTSLFGLSQTNADEKRNDESAPVFQAAIDKLGEHEYQSYREPVTVKTRSGRIIVGLHAGNRLSWPERSGQDLVMRYSDDLGTTWSPLILATEHGNFSCQSHGLVYDAQTESPASESSSSHPSHKNTTDSSHPVKPAWSSIQKLPSRFFVISKPCPKSFDTTICPFFSPSPKRNEPHKSQPSPRVAPFTTEPMQATEGKVSFVLITDQVFPPSALRFTTMSFRA